MAITKGSGGSFKGPKPPSWYTGGGGQGERRQKPPGISGEGGTSGSGGTTIGMRLLSGALGGTTPYFKQNPGAAIGYTGAKVAQDPVGSALKAGVGYVPSWAIRNPTAAMAGMLGGAALRPTQTLSGGLGGFGLSLGMTPQEVASRFVQGAQSFRPQSNTNASKGVSNTVGAGGYPEFYPTSMPIIEREMDWYNQNANSPYLPPWLFDQDGGGGGGPNWWGGRGRGGGGGYSAGYNPYLPAWSSGLYQLNANR